MSRGRSRGDFTDPEKEPFGIQQSRDDSDSDEDTLSAYSSRATSSSYQPMLNKAFPNSNKFSYFLRSPAAVMRWACLAIAGTLLLFMFGLAKASWREDVAIQIAIQEKGGKPRPEPWESFSFLQRYYGGVRTLVPYLSNTPEWPGEVQDAPADVRNTSIAERAIRESLQFDPYPDYTSAGYVAKYGSKKDCYLDAEGTIDIPRVRMYEGVPAGFPSPAMGSNALLGIRHDICYDRFGRLGPYGFGYSLNRGGSGAMQEGEREGADAVWQEHPEVDFRTVKWGEAQERCVKANQHRFADLPAPRIDRFQAMQVGSITKREDEAEPADISHPAAETETSHDHELGQLEKLPRTAVVIRTWHGFDYSPEDIIYLRSLISELSLLSGGEYVVHFLIQVHDDNAAIWSNDETYDNYLRDALPEEFRGMGTLWTERQMGLMYGGLEETWALKLPVHGVYRSAFMPLQYFAHQHPEYDFFWNWEMDIRNTGHWYNLFDEVSKWAKAQPRKFLWERNSRFYVPSEHGSWEEFMQMVKYQTEQGTNSANNIWSGLRAGGKNSPGEHMQGDRPVWGPERPLDDQIDFDTDPVPPTTHEKDRYSWGVGEDADLITFNPVFDPDGTEWLLADLTTGYNTTHGQPPRRAAIIAASRLSKRLLMTMHRETGDKRHTMFTEMWPASCALQHGLKVVYAPHSQYMERNWPTNYLTSIFNAGRNGASGGARTSVWSESRTHNFKGTTWYYSAEFPEALWNRWLGYKFNNEGGEIAELNGEGRMCLPAMLLHPIKRVEMVIEGLMGG